MPLFKCCTTVSNVCSISKELGDKAVAYLAGSTVTKKKFRNIIPTLSKIR